MLKLERSNNLSIEACLEQTILTEDNAKRSKKIKYMRTIIIDKYIYNMSREEICSECDFISLRTYTKYLHKALSILHGVL